MTSESRWINGPSFLLEDEALWPIETSMKKEDVIDSELEIRECFHFTKEVDSFDFLPDAEKFSNWNRLIQATARVFVVARKWKKIKPYHTTLADRARAEVELMKRSQHEAFPDELTSLEKTGKVDKSSRLAKLSPGINADGLIVFKGRLANADCLDMGAKEPPILCPNNRYTQLLIEWKHLSSCHFGQDRVFLELRKEVYILDCRAAVRRCWAKCLVCRNRISTPVPAEMGQLPFERVDPFHPPFYYTGVDLFGPYLVAVKRSNEKRWGVIFSCLTTRAVHLDLVESLSTSDFINCLTRFICVRGSPNVIWSDNGTNFVGAKRILRENLDEFKNDVATHLQVKGIDWRFNAPASPHMGGVYERMIGSTKKILENLLKSQHPKEGILKSLLCEVMEILNSRPLTYVSPDPDDSECLTPNHLLRMRCAWTPPIPSAISENDIVGKSWKRVQLLSDHFWKRWSSEYLLSLAKREKWNLKSPPLQIGDLVLVLDDLAPRNTWKKAIVTEVYPGKDGTVRVVKVKIAIVDPKDKDKKVKTAFLKRHVMKLCLLSSQNEDNAGAYGRKNVAVRNEGGTKVAEPGVK